MFKRLLARAHGRGAHVAAGVSVAGVVLAVSGVAWGAASGGGLPRAVDPSQVEAFVGTTPTRVLDTRLPTPNPFGPGETRTVTLAGRIDPRVSSVAINITLDADATEKSFITVWPTGESRPNASANNAEPGLVSPNQMLTKLGANQSFNIFNEKGSTHVIIDVVGVLVPLDEVELGAAGGGASAFLSGSGAPAAGVGGIGDMYFDTGAKAFYGPKSASGWGPAVSLQGPAGATGPAGPTGATGASGPIAYAYGGTGVLPGIVSGATVLDYDAATDVVVGSALSGPVDTGDSDSNPDTFTVQQAGIYEISYAIPFVGAGLGASVELRVNGVPAADDFPVSTGTVSRTQILSLSSQDTVALWVVPVLDLSLGAPHTITIKQVA